ncbi:endonuclease domain-containing protein [Nocardia asteroides]|uniref:endonuclease domain-containing protein n=1 Tax=Nocardia asteroides TaxID=1824 RepID=UPI0037C53DBE
MRPCTRCRRALPTEQFHRNAAKRDGREGTCRDCAAERKLLRRYGLSRLERQRLMDEQGRVCAICGADESAALLVVDHDHRASAGQPVVRGLLCATCNSGIGLLREDPRVLIRAAEYVQSHLAA